ncbi:hypothetical protein KEJ27_02800 [Candidatus Bathyarchaeota archaeon]|nr:hypothetical protein [Candidatus Bathyarchaeota archaeon]
MVIITVVVATIVYPVWAEGHLGPDGYYHFYARGYWYFSININYQTLGVSGRITVYNNKIKGTGICIFECVNTMFSDGSWIQIGYEKNWEGNMELKYYYEYYIVRATPQPILTPFKSASAGEVPSFNIYRSGSLNNGWVWKMIKDGSLVQQLTLPSFYASGKAEAFFESVDTTKEMSYNQGTGRFTELKYYYGGVWSSWDAIKFIVDSPYHVKPLDANKFETWGDYDADP